MRSINKCRLYLQELTLADIYECNGKDVCKKAHTGIRHVAISGKTYYSGLKMLEKGHKSGMDYGRAPGFMDKK